MKMWILGLMMAVYSFSAFAQEQLAVRLNEQGIMKVLKMAIQYNTATKESRTVIIPSNIYKFTIPKKDLLSNPVVPVLNEISDLNMNRDLDFYLNTSDIKISGDVDARSLRAQIFNSSEKGFDLRLSLNLPRVNVSATQLSLCEDRQRGTRNCGKGLKTSLAGLRISTLARPVVLSTVLRLRTDGEVARVTVRSVTSNLEGKGAPNLDINFRSIDVPKISIVIDGQETELDTSRLKDEILKRKSFLAQKLLSFAADFIADDLAEMINVYLVHKEIATSYEVYRKEKKANFNEFLVDRQNFPRVDKAYVRPPVALSRNDGNPGTEMMNQISELIRQAQVQISLKRISTPGNKDIELGGLLNFILNNRRINVKNTLGNSARTLPKLDLNAKRNYDVNLAISEPLINAALDLGNAEGLFQEIYRKLSPVQGFSIKSVKLHFAGTRALVAVVNSQVDLKKLASKGITDWFKNKIAAWLERNNNNSVIYFPIEVSVIPVFKRMPDGSQGVDLRILSPFNGDGLLNRFNYPTNVPNMTETVKDGVMDELKDSLEPYTNKNYSIDLSRFLNQAGVVFTPRTIEINQSAYLLMNLDISDIKFDSRNPNKR